ncbi:hypothetical protein COCOBI_07-3000 [Coccomyxa sp. Obi]|nr:hypothetical protein COCOBI_07-3000 [Coccomyxa sp. Obi]
MPLPTLPYKRPFFQIALAPHEIEEDMAIIITNTKRRRRSPPPQNGGKERDTHMER